MARPSDQALVSDQAAARLDPSGFDPSREESRLLSIAKQHGDLVTGDDGFVIYWPTALASRGALTSWMLRALADEIDRLNEPVQAALEAYFASRDSDGNPQGGDGTEGGHD